MKREKRGKTDNNESETVDEYIIPEVDLPNVIGLSYYSNTVVSHFVVEGVVGEFNDTPISFPVFIFQMS